MSTILVPIPRSRVATRSQSVVTIDTVRLSYPICEQRREALGYSQANRVGGYTIDLSEFVTLNMLQDRAALEASLPKYANGGDNTQCLSLSAALMEAQRLCDEYAHRIPWSLDGAMPPLDALRLARVDLVVDFHGIGDSARVLDEVDKNSRWLGIPTRRFANHGESLLLHRKRWACCLYDKHLETDCVAPFGQLRCETRLRAGRLDTPWAEGCGGRVACLSDLTEAGIAAMVQKTFDEVGFGEMLIASADFDAAVAASSHKPMEKVTLSGFRRQPQCLKQVAPDTARKYREYAAAIAAGVVGAQYLDIRRGQLVTIGELEHLGRRRKAA